MKEKALSFGTNRNLVGVLVEPRKEQAVPGAPAILTWNVGIHHRVGLYRIFVELTRSLAEAGFTCFRFDLSGLGDSVPNRNDSRSEQERGVADVRSAMQLLSERTKVDRFVLVGYCSGVDVAHRSAIADERVCGIVYLAGYRFKPRGFHLRYPLRLLDRNRWARWLKVRAPQLFPFLGPPVQATRESEQVYVRDLPTPERLRADLQRLIDRGVKVMAAYVGLDSSYSYRNQIFHMLGTKPRGAALHGESSPTAEHVFFQVAPRRQVIRDVTRWVANTYRPRKAWSAGEEKLANPGK